MIARRESKENRRIYNVKMMHRGEAELDKMECPIACLSCNDGINRAL